MIRWSHVAPLVALTFAIALALGSLPAGAQATGAERQDASDGRDGDDALNTPENRIRSQITGPELLRLMEELGTRPTLSRDNVDDPLIDAEASEDLTYTIFFYDCDDAKQRACQSLLFYVGFSLDEAVSAEDMNQWNAEQRFTRAYLDEVGDPILEMDVILYGGLSETALAERVRTWHLALNDFVEFLGLSPY
jgi:hypothetical protein